MTDLSSGTGRAAKRQAGAEHAAALELRHPGRIARRHLVVLDDVCTTGYQLDAVAGFLIERGASSVWGLVLARQPWD